MAEKDPTTPITMESNPNTQSLYLKDRDAEELKRVFNRFDANGDGKISIMELDTILRSLGSSLSAAELQLVMEDLDTDHDGFINLAEFDLYDQDRNGLISSAELHLVLNRLWMKCSIEECHRMIKLLDSDGDGNVKFE